MRRRTSTTEVMAISEHELTVMTNDLEQIHHDVGMPAMESAINEWTERSRTSRRGFLIGAGAVAGGAALVAVGSSSPAAWARARSARSAKVSGAHGSAGWSGSSTMATRSAYAVAARSRNPRTLNSTCMASP